MGNGEWDGGFTRRTNLPSVIRTSSFLSASWLYSGHGNRILSLSPSLSLSLSLSLNSGWADGIEEGSRQPNTGERILWFSRSIVWWGW